MSTKVLTPQQIDKLISDFDTFVDIESITTDLQKEMSNIILYEQISYLQSYTALLLREEAKWREYSKRLEVENTMLWDFRDKSLKEKLRKAEPLHKPKSYTQISFVDTKE